MTVFKGNDMGWKGLTQRNSLKVQRANVRKVKDALSLEVEISNSASLRPLLHAACTAGNFLPQYVTISEFTKCSAGYLSILCPLWRERLIVAQRKTSGCFHHADQGHGSYGANPSSAQTACTSGQYCPSRLMAEHDFTAANARPFQMASTCLHCCTAACF